MYPHEDQTTFTYSRCARSEKNLQAAPHPFVPVSSQSSPPFYSWSLPSESGSISSLGSSPDIPSHTIPGYNYHCSDDQLPWGFPVARDQQDAHPHTLECPLGLTSFAPSPSIGDPRARLDRLFPRIRAFGVIYTDDAKTKLREGVRRRCFNCKATETTTWRRSSLSPGKLLCNRCGLFERTHRIARPESFPRRRRTRPASAFSAADFPPFSSDFSSGEQWQCENYLSSIVPLTQYPQPFDAVGGQSISQNTSWMTQNEAGPSSSTSQQLPMYRGNSQM
jgi:hypothetical protein